MAMDSGVGCPEEALNQILEASAHLAGLAGEQWPVDESGESRFRSLRAGDLAKHCRYILRCHRGCFQPECAHGNILERCPERLKVRMERVRVSALQTLQSSKKHKDSVSVLEAGRAVARKVASFMLPPPRSSAARLTEHCDVHRQQCPVITPASTTLLA